LVEGLKKGRGGWGRRKDRERVREECGGRRKERERMRDEFSGRRRERVEDEGAVKWEEERKDGERGSSGVGGGKKGWRWRE